VLQNRFSYKAAAENVSRRQSELALCCQCTPNGGKSIMTLDYDLDKAERYRLAQDDGVYPNDDDAPQQPVHFGKGKLCKCGLRCSEDCKGGQNCLKNAPF
jgi:hypothetical protein